jgi:hypothetical protein
MDEVTHRCIPQLPGPPHLKSLRLEVVATQTTHPLMALALVEGNPEPDDVTHLLTRPDPLLQNERITGSFINVGAKEDRVLYRERDGRQQPSTRRRLLLPRDG